MKQIPIPNNGDDEWLCQAVLNTSLIASGANDGC